MTNKIPYRSLNLLLLVVMVAPLLLGCGEEQSIVAEAPGKQAFRRCVNCHTLSPGRHLTGPSLAGILGRKAGTAEGFGRYSDALKSSSIVWTAETMDAWLENPRQMIPGNRMTYKGVADQQIRRQIIAYMEKGETSQAARQGSGQGGGMMSQSKKNLKNAGPDRRVTAVNYCGSSYRVAVAGGDAIEYWEFNLRFKSDSSGDGPEPGKPVLIPAGMQGDRAYLIFAGPQEISPFIGAEC